MTKGKYKDLVDQETGEVTVVPIEYSPETYEFRSVKKADYQKKWKENSTNQFTWSFQDNVKKLLAEKRIVLSSLGALLVLLSYLDNDGYLRKRTLEDKPLLTRAEIQEILGTSVNTTTRTLNNLKSCGILIVEGTVRNQIFRINPLFHSRGKLPEDIIHVVRVQNKGIKTLHEQSNIKLDAIGFLYLLIPYMSYDSMCLVKDLDGEEGLDNALSMEEICKELGMADRTVAKYLKLKINYNFKQGEYKVPVFVYVTNPSYPSRKVTFVNPVIFRRNMKTTGELNFNELDNIFRRVAKKVEK